MKKTNFLGALVLLFSLVGLSLEAQTVRYVSAAGSGDGSSWAKASPDLQAMIDASSSGDEVWVAVGTYKPTKLIKTSKNRSYAFMLKSGVSLYGGFVGTETKKEERVIKTGGAAYEYANPSVLSADDDTPDVWQRVIDAGSTYRYTWTVAGNEANSNHVLYCPAKLKDKTVVDGFTLTGAYADVWQVQAGGAAVYSLGHLEMKRCIVRDNISYNKVEGKIFHGGAICLLETEGKAVVEDCLFERNLVKASSEIARGGAIYNDGGTVRRTLFRGSVSHDEGGAVFNTGGGKVLDCRIEDGYAAAGGAIYNADGEVSRVQIYHCRGLKGAGIYNCGKVDYALIANCFADATEFGSDMGGSGGGIYLDKGRVLGSVIYNCRAFDGGGIYIKEGQVVNSTVQHCSVRRPSSAKMANIQGPETANVYLFNSVYATDIAASEFVRPTSFKGTATTAADSAAISQASWMPTPTSQFVDTGHPTDGVVETTDIAGNPRVAGASIDQGAYEVPKAETANMTLTFASTDKEVKIGTGGGKGSKFYIDWGDGTKIEYEGAKNVTQKPLAQTVRIYGDNLLVLQVIEQGLTSLDIKNAPLLSRLQLGKNQLQALDVSANTALTGIYCEDNQIAALDVSQNKLLRVLDCHGSKIQGSVDCSAMSKLTKIDCADNTIEKLLLPSTTTLTAVDCGGNKISELNVRGLQELQELSCSDNLLTSIDLSANAKLEKLYCPGNKLQTLNLATNTALTKLSANENQLANLDLTANKAITGLYLQHNKLKQIDLQQNTALSWVNLEDNELASLDLSPLSSLKLLNASHNQISQIDLSKNPQINTLHLGNNRLATLDLNKQQSLIWLTCDSNQIATLDLQNNKNIAWLECQANLLTTLDLSKQKNLQKLFVGENQLTSLDLAANKGIQGLFIERNAMATAPIAAIITSLPDVSKVELHDNNRLWARQLNISYMPGTKDAPKAEAESKGWIVTAIFDSSIQETLFDSPALYYDASATALRASQPVYAIRIYRADGAFVLAAQDATSVSLSMLPVGFYIATAVDQAGKPLCCKFVR